MTARAFATREGEDYPLVLSTPFLVSELERVAAAMLAPLLEAGKVSVGVTVNIEHIAPTPVGAELRSHGRFLGVDGRLFRFEVWAEDPGGVVGKGTHVRAIVSLSAIESRAAERRHGQKSKQMET
jgi:predicted thioesterase